MSESKTPHGLGRGPRSQNVSPRQSVKEPVTPQAGHKSGFVCLVGRPNAGKSTLTNALVGQKIAITSSKPETTRHSVRGVITRPDAQIVLIDTPGLHRPRTLLGQRLNDVVRTTWSEVDVIGVCLPCNQKIGPGDRYLVGEVAKLFHRPVVIALLTKTDLVSNDQVRKHIDSVVAMQAEVGLEFDAFIPCSAVTGSQLDEVVEEIIKALPQGPQYYPDGEITDEPDETLIKELIREAALEDLRDELPHSLAVEIDEMRMREGRRPGAELMDLFVSLVVERDSQKAIVIGKKGQRVKRIGTEARIHIQALLGVKVHLDLKVKVLKDWQSDTKLLNRLGF